jgi:Terminase large subunit, T4likevirus-type, N-terminal
MPSPAHALRMALSRVAFAEHLGIELDDWQRAFLASDSKRILLNCSRQSGKSTMSSILALHTALYRPGSLTLCLAPSERQSKELFSKITDNYKRVQGADAPASDRKLSMQLPNGSRIEALPGTEKTIRGFSGASLLLLDEASRIDDGLYHAVRPMLAVSGGSLVMLSSPYGRRGVFFEEWTNGLGWERFEVPAWDVPRISEEFLVGERATLPGWVYRQEYECSFESTEDQAFSDELISSAFTPEVKPLVFDDLEDVS